MASLLPFDVDPHSALLAGAGTFVVTGLVWLGILRLRWRQARASHLAKKVTDTWHPILSLASFGIPPDTLPELERGEHIPFLKLWVYLQTSLRGEARVALNHVARQMNLGSVVLRMLARGHRGDRLLAIVAAGHLQLDAALPLLHLIADSDDSVLSMQAQHAILRIAPEAANLSVPRCVRRDDWPVSQLLSSLRDSGPVLLPAFLEEIDAAGEDDARQAGDRSNQRHERALRALQLIQGLHLNIEPGIQRRLLQLPDTDSLAAALKLVDHAALQPQVLALSFHDQSVVRAAAADALGRVGQPEDFDRLCELITDASWVVRHCAAKALLALPGAGAAVLTTMADTISDRYAGNMLRHVLAEDATHV